jgi:branched-subunit amino acid transport protein
MTPLLAAALAAITYGSRLAAMAMLPRPTGRIEAILARVPPAIFASLATLSLITPERTLVQTPILIAALGALLAAPRRSFALCLVAGVAGYLIGEVALPASLTGS